MVRAAVCDIGVCLVDDEAIGVVDGCVCWAEVGGFLKSEGEAEFSLAIGVRRGAATDLEAAKLGSVK